MGGGIGISIARASYRAYVLSEENLQTQFFSQKNLVSGPETGLLWFFNALDSF